MKRKTTEEKLTPCEEKALVTLQAREIKEKQKKAKARARKKAKVGSQVQLSAQGGVALAGQNLPFFMPSAPAAVTSFTPSFTAPAARVSSEWSNIASNLSQTALQYALFNQGNWKREAQAIMPGPVMRSRGVNTAPAIPPRPPRPSRPPIKQEDPLRAPNINNEDYVGPWFSDPNFNMNRANWDARVRQQNRARNQQIAAQNEIGKVIEQKRTERIKAKVFGGVKEAFNQARLQRANKFVTNVPGLGFTPGKSNIEVIDPNNVVSSQSPLSFDIIDPNRVLKTPSKKNEEKRNDDIELEEIFSGNKPVNDKAYDIIYGSGIKPEDEKQYDIVWGSGGTLTGGMPRSKQVAFAKDSTQPNTPLNESDIIIDDSMVITDDRFSTPQVKTPGSAYTTAQSETWFSANPIKGLGFGTPNTHSAKQRLYFSANKSQSPVSPYIPANEKSAIELSQVSSSSSVPLNVNIISSGQKREMDEAVSLQQQLIQEANAQRQQQLQDQLQEEIENQKQIANEAAAERQALVTKQLVAKSNQAVAKSNQAVEEESSIASRLSRSRKPSVQYNEPIPLTQRANPK